MPTTMYRHDAIVIGGGFYGVMIAAYLAARRGFSRVLLVERERALLSRASAANQARVHNGYHYPRSFTTAFRSRVNMPRFLNEFRDAVKRDFTMLYAIVRANSKVTARQFERFCHEIGARLEPAPPPLAALFQPRLIERAYLVEEYTFDADVLAHWACETLEQAGVEVRLRTSATHVRAAANEGIEVALCGADGAATNAMAGCVFNCTYSGLNWIAGEFRGTVTALKHEITELALLRVPSPLRNLGVTVMDGPFFSLMPFPPRGLHTLSHVRYTPHRHWLDQPGIDAYQMLAEYSRESRSDRMLRDAARYMPSVADSTYVESLWEVKTVLVKNEGDDGRPILFERDASLPNLYSILGSKIDNIYDVLQRLDAESFGRSQSFPAASPTASPAA